MGSSNLLNAVATTSFTHSQQSWELSQSPAKVTSYASAVQFDGNDE